MNIIVKLVELACFLVLFALGGLVVGIGCLISLPGIAIRYIGEWIVHVAGRFE